MSTQTQIRADALKPGMYIVNKINKLEKVSSVRSVRGNARRVAVETLAWDGKSFYDYTFRPSDLVPICYSSSV